jgi:serine phosphatase RsbU (regulator of sigma subunit)
MKLGSSDVDTTFFQRDIELARQVHIATLPPPFKDAALELALRYHPALGFGGDYCSVHRVGERYRITACDVSGHGIAAALMVGRINTFLREKGAQFKTPRLLTAALDRFVQENFGKLGMYLTFFVAEYDPGSRALAWHGAGHPPALWASKAQGRVVPLPSTQPPLGFDLPGRKAGDDATATLEAGDRILICTDGAIEARNQAGALFGAPALEQALWELRDQEPGAIVEKLHERILAHSPRPHDDILLLLLGVR